MWVWYLYYNRVGYKRVSSELRMIHIGHRCVSKNKIWYH